MKKFFKDCNGDTVDLGNINAYSEEWKQLNSMALWEKCWISAGRSLFYMQYLNSEIDFGKQKDRVEKMCYHLSMEHRNHFVDSTENRLWFMNWLYRFEDEVENQC